MYKQVSAMSGIRFCIICENKIMLIFLERSDENVLAPIMISLFIIESW